jgi:hypothetical protein
MCFEQEETEYTEKRADLCVLVASYSMTMNH